MFEYHTLHSMKDLSSPGVAVDRTPSSNREEPSRDLEMGLSATLFSVFSPPGVEPIPQN